MNAALDETVAVVIPTYNHAHFLGAAIESVLEQSRPADEILVVDDGSRDDPSSVVANYAGVRLLRQANAGLSAARNRGICETSSQLIIFLDADDRFKPDTIALSLETLRNSPHAAFSYGGYELVYPDCRHRATFYPVPPDSFGAFLEMNPVGMHGTVLYRRKMLEEADGFDRSLAACEDYDLYLRIARRHPIACRPEVLAEYWQHGANMSHDPAFMLHWVLQVLEARREDATAAGLVQHLDRGIVWAKGYYVRSWFGQLKSACRRRSGDRRAIVRRGIALARLAPIAMLEIAGGHIRERSRGGPNQALRRNPGSEQP